MIHKIIKVDGKYFWNMNAPAWPSPAFDRFFEFTIQQLRDGIKSDDRVRFVMLLITKKCPLNCEHCFEWNELNKKETLSLEQLVRIVEKYQSLGASHFLLGGGEPLVRFNDLLEVVKSGHKLSDFWISTSAYHLSYEKATKLKEAGLRGVSISLDHHLEELHNAFRGHSQSYENVIEGIKNAQQAGLAVALSVCTTRTFATRENLLKYAELAKRMNVGFIQLLEPRAVGRYAGKDVQLLPQHYQVLDEFYLQLNHQKKYQDFPLILHTSYNQRRFGCDAAGQNSITIDTDGYINACPFCRSKTRHALDDNASSASDLIQQEGCYKFENRMKENTISEQVF
ncbi:MAG: radical SAM protein [Cyclobacteriaceae bacterium]|nr:radical SAM protein [Cyclobacteriaceae bacterium SS2]